MMPSPGGFYIDHRSPELSDSYLLRLHWAVWCITKAMRRKVADEMELMWRNSWHVEHWQI